MDFAALPPEINSGLMYMGAGAGPLLEAGAAWAELSTELSSAAQEYTSVIGTVEAVWQGPSAKAMTAAVQPYLVWLEQTSVEAQLTADQALTAAAAYEAAFAATVPPPVIETNRLQLAILVSTNWFGQNAPAIAATEAQYMGMWAQDAAAMNAYAASSQAATTALPQFQQPPNTTSGSTPAAVTAAATGPGGWLDNSTTSGQLIQALLSSGFPFDAAQLFGNFIGYYTMAAAMMLSSNAHASVTVPETPVTFTPQTTPGTTPQTTPVRAGMGAGGSVGRLSVPPSWTRPVEPAAPRVTVEAPQRDRYQAAIPAVPFMPVTTAGRSSQGRVRTDPEYGKVSTVMPKHPYGG